MHIHTVAANTPQQPPLPELPWRMEEQGSECRYDPKHCKSYCFAFNNTFQNKATLAVLFGADGTVCRDGEEML
ncbi:unnamed protein product [Ixodes pacificus]